MQIKNYPPSKMERLYKLLEELSFSNEIDSINIEQNRNLQLINNIYMQHGPAKIVITIYENK